MRSPRQAHPVGPIQAAPANKILCRWPITTSFYALMIKAGETAEANYLDTLGGVSI